MRAISTTRSSYTRQVVGDVVATGCDYVQLDAATREARLREAAAYVPLERLALSPQCGFASVESGNPLSPGEREAKLRLITQVARRVWGERH